MKNIFLISILCISLCLSVRADTKLTAEEIVAKHLDAIGSKTDRERVKNIIGTGVVRYKILKTPSGGTGQFVFASQDEKFVFGSNFGNPNYPHEQMSFNGKDMKVAYIRPGIRSALGNFVLANKVIFDEGLFGGTLSTAWAVKDYLSKKAKIESSGMKKLGEKNHYVLDYFPKGGSDLTIKLFFDAETFRHMRTTYTQIIPARIGPNVDASAGQRETRNVMSEDYSNFETVNGLNLPMTYKVYVLNDGQAGTNEAEWTFEFQKFQYNQVLDPASFDLKIDKD